MIYNIVLFTAVCLITNFIYQEPSLLTSLQEKGVTSAILRAIFRQEVRVIKMRS